MSNRIFHYWCVFWVLVFLGFQTFSQTPQNAQITLSASFPSPPSRGFTLQNATRSFQPPAEICNNGLDDDGDGLVDFYDPDCSNDTTYFGHPVPSCSADLSQGSNFTIGQEYATPTGAGVAVYNTPIAGDIDNDGSVELIIMSDDNLTPNSSRATRNLRIFEGGSGQLERTIQTPFMGWSNASPLGMADVDSDGKGEIVIISSGDAINPLSDRRYLFCYEDDGTLKWKSSTQVGYSDADFGSSVNFADFNQDGIPEVYVYNQVFNAQNGILLAQGGNSRNLGRSVINANGNPANSFAADILGQFPGLELVAGNQVYLVNITNPNGTLGNTMGVATTTINLSIDGFSAVADMDLDGDLDIINTHVDNTNEVKLTIWDGQTSTLLASTFTVNGASQSGMVGIPTVGDIDGDCAPEILIVTSRRLSAYELNGGSILQKWNIATSDASAATGQTLFDFNQDGQVEIVYRDESNVRIINGNTGANLSTFPCNSGTGWENPIVVDVDGDSQAEIVVTCGGSSTSAAGVLRVYGTAGDPWAPAREVWNQKSYQPVAINDDLSIPRTQQDHAFSINGASCGCNGINRPVNNFVVQSTLLDAQGCPLTPVPDLSLQIDSVSCLGTTGLQVFFQVTNSGSAILPIGGQVAFYEGNPESSNAPFLGTITLPAAVDTGQTLSFIGSISIATVIPPITLFGIINDDGTASRPYDLNLDFPVTSIAECDYTNNVDSILFPGCCPASLGISGVITDENCPGASDGTIDVSVSGGEAPYTFQWNDNASTEDRTQLAPGTYTVIITDANGCSDQATFTVNPGSDSEAPVITCPADTILQCLSEVPPFNTNDVVATDNCGISSVITAGFQDNGGSGCAGDPRIISRTFATVDVNGNVATCVQTFTVEASPIVTIASPNDFVFPDFPDSSCADISVIATGGCPPYTYLWSNGVTTATQTVCPGATTLYTVTVTDAQGCTQMDSVQVCTVDISCVDNPTPGPIKVLVCNVPPGNPQGAQTQCLTLSAAQALFSNRPGSYLGACGTLPFRACNFQPCANAVTIDFEQDASGNALVAGQDISGAYASMGVTFTVTNNRTNHPHKGILFNTAAPTGGDTDLGTPNAAFGGPGIGSGGGSGNVGVNAVALGNVLIIAENDVDINNDGLVDDPDDEAAGGEIRIDFNAPTEVFEIELLDLDDGSGGNLLFAQLASGATATFPIPDLGDNSTYKFPLSLSGVSSIRIQLAGSGALAGITYCDLGGGSKVAQSGDDGVDALSPNPVAAASITAYPNPFRDQVTFELDLQESVETEIVIADLSGKVMKVLHPGELEAGLHRIRWNGNTSGGQMLANGIYFARVRMGQQVETMKLVLRR